MKCKVKSACWALCLGGLLSACGTRPPSAQDESAPEIQLDGVGVRFFRGNDLRAVARAQHATFRRGTGDLTANALRLRLLAGVDRPEIEVTAHEADGNLRSQTAQARGGVRIAETAGAAGVTEAAVLDGKASRASGALPVDIVGDTYRIHAEAGFVLDLKAPGALALQGPIDTTVGGLR